MSSHDLSASGRLPHAFTTPGSSSFVEFLSGHAPQLLPGNRPCRRRRRWRRTAPRSSALVVRRRHRHGRRPPRDHGLDDREPRDREGLPGRRVLRGRHRRHRGPRGRAGPAVPARARALREDRGQPAVARRQGQPAGDHDPRQPRARDAGAGRGAAVRRLRPRPAHRSDLLLRRHGRPLRGARPPRGRLGLGVRARLAQEAVAPGARRRGRGAGRRRGARRRGRRRLGDRRSGPHPAASGRSSRPSPSPGTCAWRTTSSRRSQSSVRAANADAPTSGRGGAR